MGSDRRAVAARLAAFAAGETSLPSGRRPRAPVPVAFLFAGQGGQRRGLGRDLFARPGPFREAIERCDALLRPHRREALVDVLYPRADRGLIDETEWTQPALFAVEWALAQQWKAWGVEPAWVLGHSLGAFVAATVAGVMSLDAALALVARRAELMQATAPGAMAAVFAAEEAVTAALADAEVVVTAVNGPAAVVIGGAPAAIDDALARLAAAGLRTRRLAVGRAFHSPLMAPVLADLKPPSPPSRSRRRAIPFISDGCGPTSTRPARRLAPPPARAGALRRRDARALRAPARRAARSRSSAAPAVSSPRSPAPRAITALPSLRREQGARASMLDALGRLAVAGARCASPPRTRAAGGSRCRVMPSSGARHWAGARRAPTSAAGDPLIGVRRPETGAIVYEATWSPGGAAGVLRDHTVHGRVVVSGAVTSAAALAALRAAGVEGRRVVEAVEFTAPLTLDGPRRVELRLVARGGGHDFEVATLDPRRLHLRGRIGHHETPPPPPVELAAVRARCVETIAGDDFYARFWDPARHHLGPSYRLIETIWRRDGEALARLRPPPADPGLDATRAPPRSAPPRSPGSS
ncbi:MAG: acyltransferase domain-containing protein [Myxococcales bacterium]|nr:acyltransferase domain-containing protein [Myxococcales bacterium]